MARRYARDNRGRFATTGTGATARGGRLKTAAGNTRATQTIQAGGRAGTVKKSAGLNPKVAPKRDAAPKASKRLRFERAYHGTTPATAAAIKKSGFVPSKDGAQGPGVYITTDRKAAQIYARLAAGQTTSNANTSIVRLRIPRSTRNVVDTGSNNARDAVQAAIRQGKAGSFPLWGGGKDIISSTKLANSYVAKAPTIRKTVANTMTKQQQWDTYMATGKPKQPRVRRTKPKR